MEFSRRFPATYWLWHRRAALAYTVLGMCVFGVILYKASDIAYLCGDWLNRQRAWRTERQELTNIAGNEAKDCGYVRFGEDAEVANRCALQSLAQNKPFYVAYDVQGMDSHLIVGLALDKSANFFTVKYDSMGWETAGVVPPHKVIGHVSIKPCKEPPPQVTPRGYLSCDWPRNW